VLHFYLVGRAAERPPLTRLRQRPRIFGLTALILGAALEAGVSLLLGLWDGDYLELAAALGILIAVLAGAVGGLWVGLAVAAAGWTLQFFLIADESLRLLAALPAWLTAGAIAGWVAVRLREQSAEDELLRDQLTAVRDSTADAIIGVDLDGSIIAWNPGAEAIYGYSTDEVLGRKLAILTGDDEADNEADPTTDRLLEALRRGERFTEPDVTHRRKDGAAARVSLTATPIETEAGQATNAVVVATDVGQAALADERFGELEARYRSLTHQLPGITYIHPADKRGELLYVSPQVGTMLGYTAAELLGQPDLFPRLVHEDDRERVSGEVARATKSAAPLRTEYRMLARQGDEVSVRDEAVTVRAGDGRPLYIQGHLRDVSAERQTQAERQGLRNAERAAAAESTDRQRKLDLLSRVSVALGASLVYETTLRRAADLAVEGLADWCIVDVIDEQGTTVRVAVAHAAGVDPGAGAPIPEPEVIEVARRGESTMTETRICVPMLTVGRSLGVITLVVTATGRSYGADDLALAEHLARTAALAVDNGRLHRQVQESADAAHVLTYVADGVFLVDPAGVIRLWNPTAEGITGLAAWTVLGHEAADVIPDWQMLAERIPVGVAPDHVQPETLPIDTEAGERWISVSGIEFFGGTVYAFRDLTEARRLEQLKAEFVATASHELRTPLAAVYGAAQTLRRHDFALDEAGRDRFLSLIVDESERLGRIVNDILLANQLDVGNLDLRSELFDPNELVERVVEAARVNAPPGIELEATSIASASTVASDRDRVRQVLANLVENAIKYSPDGGRVEVGVASVGKKVRFYVRDEGVGIPPNEQARVFEKFYRLDPDMTGGIGGTGLGLYICNELVQRMGGRIWVESKGEIGSKFLFEIPSDTLAARSLVQEVLETSDG